MERYIFHGSRRYRILVGNELPFDRTGLLKLDRFAARRLMSELWCDPDSRQVLARMLRHEFNQYLLHSLGKNQVVNLLANYFISVRFGLVETEIQYPNVGEDFVEERKKAVPVMGALSTWIEIALVDERGEPVPGALYEIRRPDGAVLRSGKLDSSGCVRVDSIFAGKYRVCFLELNRDRWSGKT